MEIHKKSKQKILCLLAVLALILVIAPAKTYAAHDHSPALNVRNFRMLDHYGEWIENTRFGRVWKPYVVATWRPFLYGDWDWVDDSWFWDSYEPFGWVVYHYGNWYYLQDTGWVWIPGYDWSPAQVTWLDFDDYIGWAPLAPAGYYWPDPWNAEGVVVWNVVFIRDFHKHELDKNVIKTAIPKPSDPKRVARNRPELQRIETATNTKIENLKLKNTNVKEGKNNLKQAELPKDHVRQTQMFRNRIQREILTPRMAVNKRH